MTLNQNGDGNENLYDVAIIGGGINGTSVARDASGRGLKTLLIEKNDLASATSSASSKLLHGGLRYLENYEFKLVREAIQEREVLIKTAPHIAWRMRFILPYLPNIRPAWMIRVGLFLYDNIARLIRIPKSNGVNLRKHLAGFPLKDNLKKGFEYSDLGVMDSRFTLYNAMDAYQRGADIHFGLATSAKANADNQSIWDIQTQDKDGTQQTFHARSLVNASGPWVADVIGDVLHSKFNDNLRKVQGSHIIVPKLYEHNYCYMFQNRDKRVIFVIPYENDYSMIGTTDVDYDGDPDRVHCTDAERAYLCETTNEYFKVQITPSDIVWDFAGVRPIHSAEGVSAQTASRDYLIKVENKDKDPLLINLFGGKMTAGREIGEKVLDKLAPLLGCTKPAWTHDSCLPGGDIEEFDIFYHEKRRQYPFLKPNTIHRMCRFYGTYIDRLLNDAKTLEDMGENFGADLYQKEVDYMIQYEWAHDLRGIIWIRSRIGLHINSEEQKRLEDYLKNKTFTTFITHHNETK